MEIRFFNLVPTAQNGELLSEKGHSALRTNYLGETDNYLIVIECTFIDHTFLKK